MTVDGGLFNLTLNWTFGIHSQSFTIFCVESNSILVPIPHVRALCKLGVRIAKIEEAASSSRYGDTVPYVMFPSEFKPNCGQVTIFTGSRNVPSHNRHGHNHC